MPRMKGGSQATVTKIDADEGNDTPSEAVTVTTWMPASVVGVVRMVRTPSPEPPNGITEGETEARRSSASVAAVTVTSPATVEGMNVVMGTVVAAELAMTRGAETAESGRTTTGPAGVGCGVPPPLP